MDAIGWIDALVLLAAFAVAVVVGLRFSGRGGTLETYFVGDRDLPWWAILGSIVATETSAVTVLSVPGSGFGSTGMKFLQLAIGLLVGKLLVAYFLMPLFFSRRLLSAYELLETRFGLPARRFASLVFLITRNVSDGLRLYLAALVLHRLVGWPIPISAATMGFVTLFYTYLGGMRSVVWNDCVQLLVYLAGGLATVWVIAAQIPGGWAAIAAFAVDTGKSEIFRFDFSVNDPDCFWVGLVGGAFLSLGTHGADQLMVQRYISARSLTAARWALVLSGVVVLLQFALFLWIGIELACFYQATATTFEKPDDVYIRFILDEFPRNTGLVGLMLAAIMAATMSTLSSSLNSSATVLVTDWFPMRTGQAAAGRPLAYARAMTVVFGAIQVGFAIWASRWNAAVIVNALTIAGFAFGLLLGMFALAVWARRVEQSAAMGGAMLGLATLLFIHFVGPTMGLKIAPYWYAFLGSMTTFTGGCLLQWLLGNRDDGRGCETDSVSPGDLSK